MSKRNSARKASAPKSQSVSNNKTKATKVVAPSRVTVAPPPQKPKNQPKGSPVVSKVQPNRPKVTVSQSKPSGVTQAKQGQVLLPKTTAAKTGPKLVTSTRTTVAPPPQKPKNPSQGSPVVSKVQPNRPKVTATQSKPSGVTQAKQGQVLLPKTTATKTAPKVTAPTTTVKTSTPSAASTKQAHSTIRKTATDKTPTTAERVRNGFNDAGNALDAAAVVVNRAALNQAAATATRGNAGNLPGRAALERNLLAGNKGIAAATKNEYTAAGALKNTPFKSGATNATLAKGAKDASKFSIAGKLMKAGEAATTGITAATQQKGSTLVLSNGDKVTLKSGLSAKIAAGVAGALTEVDDVVVARVSQTAATVVAAPTGPAAPLIGVGAGIYAEKKYENSSYNKMADQKIVDTTYKIAAKVEQTAGTIADGWSNLKNKVSNLVASPKPSAAKSVSHQATNSFLPMKNLFG